MRTMPALPGCCRTPAALVVAVVAGTTLANPVGAQEFDFTGHAPIRANAPGLECRQTDHPIFAYGSPSPSARPVSRIATLMAVSGPAEGGWVPVELNGRRKGWVRAAETVRNSYLKSCFVGRARDGHLIYSVYNRIS